MRGDYIMKRFICILFAFLIIIPSAYAADLENFCMYSELFGAHEVREEDGDVRDPYIRFIQDDCTITFRIDSGKIGFAMITGDGDAFLAYCFAALMEFDPSSKNSATNGGQLLMYYLMCKESIGKHLGQTVSGCVFVVERDEKGLSFVIGE
jgi:hypothetical protein